MNLLGKVRRLHYRDRLSLSEVERRTGLTRKTIRKWLKAPEGVEPKYRRKDGDTKITVYAKRLVKMLETDARRLPRERRTALKLYAELKAAGFAGGYSRVTEFIRRWRTQGGAAARKSFVPLQFELGEAHQFDWSEEHLVVGGVWRKLLVALSCATAVPSSSRHTRRKVMRCCSTPLHARSPHSAVFRDAASTTT